jgi:prepilin-type processing-associated H-X9-DG protein
VTNAVNTPTTIPAAGFNRVIRASYWVNSDNPIGTAATATNVRADIFYTTSVGFGPFNGSSIPITRTRAFTRPSQLIAIADGVYAGKQGQNRINVDDSRIGYRHPGGVGSANTAFADGHANPVAGDVFPRGGNSADNISSAGPTLYADPRKFFGL